jgi:hypothetical protein
VKAGCEDHARQDDARFNPVQGNHNRAGHHLRQAKIERKTGIDHGFLGLQDPVPFWLNIVTALKIVIKRKT